MVVGEPISDYKRRSMGLEQDTLGEQVPWLD